MKIFFVFLLYSINKQIDSYENNDNNLLNNLWEV